MLYSMSQFLHPVSAMGCNSFDIVCVCLCLCVWVYSGYIIHHYNGIWGTCAPGRRNMHQQGVICTMVHKGDYVFYAKPLHLFSLRMEMTFRFILNFSECRPLQLLQQIPTFLHAGLWQTGRLQVCSFYSVLVVPLCKPPIECQTIEPMLKGTFRVRVLFELFVVYLKTHFSMALLRTYFSRLIPFTSGFNIHFIFCRGNPGIITLNWIYCIQLFLACSFLLNIFCQSFFFQETFPFLQEFHHSLLNNYKVLQ